MVLTRVVRCVSEAAVCIVAVGLAESIVVANKDKDSTKSQLKKGDELIKQAESLTAESFDILTAVDRSWSNNLRALFPLSSRKKTIQLEDLEEFHDNLCWGGDDGSMQYESEVISVTEGRPLGVTVDEKYRAFPTKSLEKFMYPSEIQTSSRQSLVRNALFSCIHREFGFSQILDSFDKYQYQISREMEAAMIEMHSPREAFWNSRMQLFAQVVAAGGSCFALNRLFPEHGLTAIFPSMVKAPMIRSALWIFPMYCILHGAATTAFSSLLDLYNMYNGLEVVEAQSKSSDGSRVVTSNNILGLDGEILRPSLVWPCATRSDPFTIERLTITCVDNPVVQETVFRGILFARLLSLSTPFWAHLLSMIAFAGSREYTTDARATSWGRTEEECFAINLLTSYFLQRMYQLTGRLIFPILMHSALYYRAIMNEFFTRDGLVYEQMSLWPLLIKLSVQADTIYSIVHDIGRVAEKIGFAPRDNLLVQKNGEPQPAIRDLAAFVIRNFSTDDRRNVAPEKQILLPSDILEYWDALTCALVKCDQRQRSEKSAWARARELHCRRPEMLSAEQRKAKEQEIRRLHRDFGVFVNSDMKMEVSSKGDELLSQTGEMQVFAQAAASEAVKAKYTGGMTLAQVQKDIIDELQSWDRAFLERLDYSELKRHMVRWDNASEDEVLDLIADYMNYVMLFNEEAARRFERFQGDAFVASLAGRRATEEDLKRYQAQFVSYMELATRRARANALAPHGLSLPRLQKLLRKRAAESREVKKLVDEWNQYFKTKHQTKLNSLSNPFK